MQARMIGILGDIMHSRMDGYRDVELRVLLYKGNKTKCRYCRYPTMQLGRTHLHQEQEQTHISSTDQSIHAIGLLVCNAHMRRLLSKDANGAHNTTDTAHMRI